MPIENDDGPQWSPADQAFRDAFAASVAASEQLIEQFITDITSDPINTDGIRAVLKVLFAIPTGEW